MVGRVIVRIGGVLAIVIAAAALFVGVIGGDRPTQVFIPWSVAYLLLGLLMIFAARKI